MSNTQEAKEANIKRIYYNLDEVGDEAWKAYARGMNHCKHGEYQKGIAEFDRAIQLYNFTLIGAMRTVNAASSV